MTSGRTGGWEYQPHWVWALILIFAPLILVSIGLWGLPIGSAIPFGVAEAAPAVALAITSVGMLVSLIRRRRTLIAIAAIGLTISAGGLLMLLWVT